MSLTPSRPHLLQDLTPELVPALVARTETLLLKIVRTNLNTQYASKAVNLAQLRDATSANGASSDILLVQDFQRTVPLSDYDAYKPFMAAFENHPCKEAELENLFAPGLPYLLASSSATSGKKPKVFPKYNSRLPSTMDGPGPAAVIVFYGYAEAKVVEREPGQIVKRIPVSTVTCGIVRAMQGWTNIDDDNSRMPTMTPGFVAPWAASVINSHKSFLMIHALFSLACRDIDRIFLTFSTLFYDLLRYIDEQWDMFLSSIREGTIPHLPGVQDVHSHLQAHFYANPDRATELAAIGPPLSCAGWAVRVWPKLRMVSFGCAGPFATVLPKVLSIIGPTVTINPIGYGSSESFVAFPLRPDDLEVFVLAYSHLVEFLDVTAKETHENLLKAWELKVGEQYEVVVTTTDGLWRYRLGDLVRVVGFDAEDGSPAFVLLGRRSLAIRLGPSMLMPDTHLISAIQAVSPDVMQVGEFTTLLDDRRGILAVGYLVEVAGTLGPDGHLAPLRLSEGLADRVPKFKTLLEDSRASLPTVRIVKPGTFAAYRQWKAERMNVGPGQVKVPAVLVDEASKEWILEKVVREL